MITQENCLFCKIIAGQIPSAKVYDDADVYVFMNLQQTQPGHSLIIPKDHHENIFDIPDEALSKVALAAAKVARAVKAAFNSDGVQILQNNGSAAWQSVFHLHMHVIPRYKNDVGADLYAIWTKGQAATPDELEANAAKIRASLS